MLLSHSSIYWQGRHLLLVLQGALIAMKALVINQCFQPSLQLVWNAEMHFVRIQVWKILFYQYFLQILRQFLSILRSMCRHSNVCIFLAKASPATIVCCDPIMKTAFQFWWCLFEQIDNCANISDKTSLNSSLSSSQLDHLLPLLVGVLGPQPDHLLQRLDTLHHLRHGQMKISL